APRRQHLTHGGGRLRHDSIGIRRATTQAHEQTREARIHGKEDVLGAQTVREILQLTYRDGRGVIVIGLPFDWDNVAHFTAVWEILGLAMAGEENDHAVLVLRFGKELIT